MGVTAMRNYRKSHPNDWLDTGLDALSRDMDCLLYTSGLAADLNSPEHTDLTEGFENTEAFRWLSAHAVEYGFILRLSLIHI